MGLASTLLLSRIDNYEPIITFSSFKISFSCPLFSHIFFLIKPNCNNMIMSLNPLNGIGWDLVFLIGYASFMFELMLICFVILWSISLESSIYARVSITTFLKMFLVNIWGKRLCQLLEMLFGFVFSSVSKKTMRNNFLPSWMIGTWLSLKEFNNVNTVSNMKDMSNDIKNSLLSCHFKLWEPWGTMLGTIAPTLYCC